MATTNPTDIAALIFAPEPATFKLKGESSTKDVETIDLKWKRFTVPIIEEEKKTPDWVIPVAITGIFIVILVVLIVGL